MSSILKSCAALLLLAPSSVHAALDLSRAVTTRLDNGLTLIVLEDHTRPVASVQMLYTVGARNEPLGQSGIAHFLEHMAFRSTKNFPNTEVVSAIYAIGGEWHGYTWLDQTTYFETVPAEHLDLALRIEADRMTALEIPEADVEAERGAVLAEMHGYENDPASRLKDALLTVSFLQHPYRNNTIGWESDVENTTHQNLVDFYRRHYRPANAILSIVGSVSLPQVVSRVRELFGDLPASPASSPPPTVEPPQIGVRRVDLEGPGSRDRFEVAYRAPSVTHPDYPAFLILQKILGGGSGVNFLQNEWGDAVPSDSRLAGVTDDLVTWFIPTASPYVFTIAGSLSEDMTAERLEARLEERMAGLREDPPSVGELEKARRSLLDELVFDIETTEDAAHQLAYFTGIGGADVLEQLPHLLQMVTPTIIHDVAQHYLRPHQRTIGWYRIGPAPSPTSTAEIMTSPPNPEPRPTRAGDRPVPRTSVSSPSVVRLASGLPVIFQREPLTSSAQIRLLVPTTLLDTSGRAERDHPVWRHTSIDFRFRPGELASTINHAREVLAAASLQQPTPATDIDHPARRLARELDDMLGAGAMPPTRDPVAVSLVGDVRQAEALALLESTFGDVEPADPTTTTLSLKHHAATRRVALASPPAQARLGYVVPAPPPSNPESTAWRLLLYTMSHGYEGRLGTEAISRRGLVYYIDARYATDGANARISFDIGVDPPKLEAMATLLALALEDLRDNPPTEAELAEAKQHLIGRRATAAQSNEEISTKLFADWIGYGRLLGDAEFATIVQQVTLADVHEIVPAFVAGATVIVSD